MRGSTFWTMEAGTKLSTEDNQPRNIIFKGQNLSKITTLVSAGRTPINFSNMLDKMEGFEEPTPTQPQTTALPQVVAPRPELRTKPGFEL